ncbi:MAG: glycosyltransferase family 4 protein [Candidatus Niyogibacteria bacterium]|nr:glycosyltransferase family 4 protein [Candidatus Niyogibacteria bacterium]
MPVENRKQKLCYVLPEYDINTDTHFAHVYDFIEKLSEEFSLFIVIERSASAKPFEGVGRVYIQHFRIKPLRMIENFLILLIARVMGYGNMYVHYSYISAWNAALVARIFAGRSFYWNCGMPWLFGEDAFLNTIVRSVHVLVTGTPRMAKLYAETYGISPDKIRVMPNWIDNEHFPQAYTDEEKSKIRSALGISAEKKIALFVHRLSERKGAHFLPDIAVSLSEKNTLLIIIGSGPLQEWLEGAIQEYDLSSSVRILGSVAHADLSQYYAIADVFLMPSLEEGFPHVLLETMAYGVPFVATNIGGVPDITPTVLAQFIVEPEDIIGFSTKTKNILALDPAQKQEIRQALTLWVRRYDISVALERFKKILTEGSR